MMNTHYLNVGQRETSRDFLHALPTVIEKSTLTKSKAEFLIHLIAHASTRIFKNVVLLMVNKGYLVLGFTKPQDCLRNRIPKLSDSDISQLLSATEWYLKLDHLLIHLDKVTEATFSPLQNVDNADAVKVWSRTLTVLTDNCITSKHIQCSMDALHIKAVETKPSEPLPIDAALFDKLAIDAQAICTQFILPHVHSKTEYEQRVNLIHKQLLSHCPL
ncbi:MAG: hypothetical protein K9K84_11775 [Methylovulum sp.]|nr:hypothetical protein [Methylovulum sp.]